MPAVFPDAWLSPSVDRYLLRADEGLPSTKPASGVAETGLMLLQTFGGGKTGL